MQSQDFSDWDKAAPSWEHSDVKKYCDMAFESLIQKAKPLLPQWEEVHVFDFGCGTGLLTEKLQPLCKDIIALDPSQEMIKVLDSKITKKQFSTIKTFNLKLNSDFLQNNSELIQSRDLIVASSVLSFVPNLNDVFFYLDADRENGLCFG